MGRVRVRYLEVGAPKGPPVVVRERVIVRARVRARVMVRG